MKTIQQRLRDWLNARRVRRWRESCRHHHRRGESHPPRPRMHGEKK